MYTIGLQPQISALYPDVEFPVSQATPFLGHLATWDHSFSWSSNVEINEVRFFLHCCCLESDITIYFWIIPGLAKNVQNI